MLTVRYRLNNRFRPIEADPELLAAIAAAAASPTSIEPVDEVKRKAEETIEHDDRELIYKIRQIEKENRYLRRENLFFIRYLRRIQTSKVLEKFSDFQQIDDSNLSEILGDIGLKKFMEIPRRLTSKSSAYSSASSLHRVRLSSNISGTSPFPIVIRKRLQLAHYECEQTRLELERMIANANTDLDNLKLQFRMVFSDAISQTRLIHEVERYIERYRSSIGDEEFSNPHLKVPAELFVSRIKKRIHSRGTVIGLVRANSLRLHDRLEGVNRKIQSLNELHEEMDDVDVTLNTTRQVDFHENYDELERIYHTEKQKQYPSFLRVQQLKKALENEKYLWNEAKKKIVMLKNIYEENQREIEQFQYENDRLSDENYRLTRRLAQFRKVPSITEYAYIIKQLQFLEEQIAIWTQRVAMIETFHCQLKQQAKSERFLPPLTHPSLSSSSNNLLE